MPSPRRYGIIGSGNVGTSMARLFARAGVDVAIANTRGAQSLNQLAGSLGPTVHAVDLEDALSSDVVVMAVPFPAVADLGASRSDWSGTIVIDATNAFYTPDADALLQGRSSTRYTADHFPGAAVVKAFNQLSAATLAAELDPEVGRRVIFIATDSPRAGELVAELVDQLGLSPVLLGRIDDGGRLIQVPGPLTLRHLIERPR